MSAWGRRPDLLRIAAALGTGVSIAAVYLIPAIALEPYRSSADLWALPYLQPAGWTVWNAASWNVATFSAVTIVAAGLAIALVALLLRHRSGWGFWALACTGLAVGVLPFIWSVPLLRSVQFPFRLLPVAELAFVTAFALAPKGRAPWIVAWAMLLVMARLITVAQPESPPFGDSVIRAVHPDVPENLPPGKRPYSWPSKWALEVAAEHRQPQFGGRVTIDPVFYFPAWEVRCGGRLVRPFPDAKTQLLAYEGRGCSRTLVRTAPERIGAFVSLAALILLISLSLSPWSLARRRSPPAKAALAVHEIVAPQIVERLFETLQRAVRHRIIIPSAPLLQRFGIIEAKTLPVLPLQSAFERQSLEPHFIEQQAAREYVGLDEVGVTGIAIEQAVIDRNELERGSTAPPGCGRCRRGNCPTSAGLRLRPFLPTRPHRIVRRCRDSPGGGCRSGPAGRFRRSFALPRPFFPAIM